MAAVYLDSNIVISLVEDDPSGESALAARLGVLAGPDGRYVVSDWVRLEYRVKPLAVGDPALLSEYDAYFRSMDVRVLTPTALAYDRASEIRARHGYETPDALHLATAIEANCGMFATGDRRLADFTDIAVALVAPD